MVDLTPIQLDDGTVIYIEATEEVNAPTVEQEPGKLIGKGGQNDTQSKIDRNFQAIEGTIRAYTNYTLNAFKQVAIANVDKVTLKFGIKVAGEAGIPYITKGTAESNLEVTVECSFPSHSELNN